jgi:hypothetical protein
MLGMQKMVLNIELIAYEPICTTSVCVLIIEKSTPNLMFNTFRLVIR